MSAGAGLDGLSCEPCWLPQPPQAAAGACWCYTEPTASGRAAGDNTSVYSLFTGGAK